MNEPQQKTDILRSAIQYGRSDPGVGLAMGLIVAMVLFGLLVSLARFITDFSAELRILNIEIKRSEGEEREYYLHQRRRLWLSLIPFVKY